MGGVGGGRRAPGRPAGPGRRRAGRMVTRGGRADHPDLLLGLAKEAEPASTADGQRPVWARPDGHGRKRAGGDGAVPARRAFRDTMFPGLSGLLVPPPARPGPARGGWGSYERPAASSRDRLSPVAWRWTGDPIREHRRPRSASRHGGKRPTTLERHLVVDAESPSGHSIPNPRGCLAALRGRSGRSAWSQPDLVSSPRSTSCSTTAEGAARLRAGTMGGPAWGRREYRLERVAADRRGPATRLLWPKGAAGVEPSEGRWWTRVGDSWPIA